MTDLACEAPRCPRNKESRLSNAVVKPHLEPSGWPGSAIVNGKEGGGLLEEPVESRCALNEDMVVSR